MGFPCERPGGSFLVCEPPQDHGALRLLNRLELNKNDVVIAESLCYLVDEALATIPSRRRPKTTRKAVGTVLDLLICEVRRTFLGYFPRKLAASAVVQSTAHAPNPR